MSQVVIGPTGDHIPRAYRSDIHHDFLPIETRAGAADASRSDERKIFPGLVGYALTTDKRFVRQCLLPIIPDMKLPATPAFACGETAPGAKGRLALTAAPPRRSRGGIWPRRLALASLLGWAALAATLPAPRLAAAQPTSGVSAGRAAVEPPFTARLQHLSDGDSFIVRTEDARRLTIRLVGIDAPEKAQAYGDDSRRSLRDAIEGQTLTILPVKRDPYGRLVARVFVGDKDVALEQVRTGLAWHYRRYESDQTPSERREFSVAEQHAREAGIGLWADPSPLPPWRYREQQRGR